MKERFQGSYFFGQDEIAYHWDIDKLPLGEVNFQMPDPPMMVTCLKFLPMCNNQPGLNGNSLPSQKIGPILGIISDSSGDDDS
ncbi:hypothetical protein OROHE_001762 [Orobanche hederae]